MRNGSASHFDKGHRLWPKNLDPASAAAAQQRSLPRWAPAHGRPNVVEMLALAGVDVFRLNFSHGSHEEHQMVYETIRRVEHKLGFPIAVLADMQGPKIRVGTFEDGKIDLKMGETYTLIAGETASGGDVIPVPHADILGILEPGDLILLNDGLLQLVVKEVGASITVTANTPWCAVKS